jgi:hypothetical protein
MHPEVWTTRPFDPQVERVVLTLDVVGATRPQVVAHPLLGVLLLAQRAHPVWWHMSISVYQRDKSFLDRE